MNTYHQLHYLVLNKPSQRLIQLSVTQHIHDSSVLMPSGLLVRLPMTKTERSWSSLQEL